MGMFRPWSWHVFRVVVFAFVIFQTNSIAYGQVPVADYEPPTIDHNPSLPAAKSGEAYTILVNVTDNTLVKEVILHYKSPTEDNYRSVTMQNRGEDRFQVVLPPTDVLIPQMEYYIQAVDTAGNAIFRGAPFSPLVLKVAAGVAALGTETNDSQEAVLRGELATGDSSSTPSAGLNWKKILGGLLVVGLIVSLTSTSEPGDPPAPSASPPTVFGTVLIDASAP